MKLAAPLILSLFISTICDVGISQQNADFSKPVLSLEETVLVVRYDIRNSLPSERFIIKLEVTDSLGRHMNPRSVSGDIGDDIGGGYNKMIRWDLFADQVSLDQTLNVEIVGKRVLPEEGLVEGVAEDKEQISRMGAVGRSVLFPGWGLSKVYPGKPHWIKGIAAYGSIAGSLILNQRALANYQNYQDSDDTVDRRTFYDKSVTQEQFSNILAYTAAGIWVADFVWTLVGTRTLSKRNASVQRKGVSLGTDYEAACHAPMLSLRYTF